MTGRLGLTDLSPEISCGRYPARAAVGEAVPIGATVFREGHAAVAANVVWRRSVDRGTRTAGNAGTAARSGTAARRDVTARTGAAPSGAEPLLRMHPGTPGTDRFHATVTATEPGMWSYVVEAWGDPVATWLSVVEAKLDAGQDVADLANDIEDGARLFTRAARGVPKPDRPLLTAAVAALRDSDLALPARLGPALEPSVAALLHRWPLREMITRSARREIWVDRVRALYGSWYELFPRSTGGVDSAGRPRHGNFRTAAERLPAIAAMGFDVVYLPPVHPIGEVNRKGPNNALLAGPEDVGSPWGIGSAAGGFDAIHPQLGTMADFDDFVAATRDAGMEVALDLALQCAPDHPWTTEHPEWFTTRPDGSIAYAENPPKKYQDIYPLSFDNDPAGIRAAVLAVVLGWVDHGVKIFRVDNPHTKPLDFWHWLIWRIKAQHPDVLFLAEAFTKPAMMHELARLGFTQSYTYFTWRTGRDELAEYGAELARAADYMRPNFFVNTPDILHASLQYGGPAMFAIRATLAATMSPTWGIYSGYELFEHVAVRPGSEEYLDSEKFQLRSRDFRAAEREGRSLAPYITRLNSIRRANPALRQLRDIHFHPADNDQVLVFSKRDERSGNTMLVVCTLDPHSAREATVHLDLPALGLEWSERFFVHDEISGATYDWGQSNYVRLDPYVATAHIFSCERHTW